MPETGRRTWFTSSPEGAGDPIVVSQPGVRGSGPDFGWSIGGMAVDSDYQILLLGFDRASLFKVDPTTGDRSILSGQGVGSGPALEHPVGLTRTLTGDFYAFDADTEAVFFVDGTTGDRRIVSGAGAGGGPEFSGFGSDVVLMKDGTLAVSDHEERLLRVDPLTGTRSVLTGGGVGTGPNPDTMEFVTLNADGTLLATSATDGLILVDPTTGNRSWVVGYEDAVRDGGAFREGIQANPEPSTAGLLTIFGSLAVMRRPKRHRAPI